MELSQLEELRLPPRTFLYTLDQIEMMLGCSRAQLQKHLFLHGVMPGRTNKDLMVAVNLNPPGEKPDWRIKEGEFVRFLRYKGFTTKRLVRRSL